MPTYKDWKSAIKAINLLTGPRTANQLKLANYCGISVTPREPAVIVAARLRLALTRELNTDDSLRPSKHLSEYLKLLCQRPQNRKTPKVASKGIGKAWITYLHLKRRKEALTRLKLKSGDIVSGGIGYAEVASINNVGRVFFKGRERGGNS